MRRKTRWPKGAWMKLASANTLCALMEQRDNMSMGTLARYAGCSKGFISHLTSGRRSTCTPQLAERIAEALNVPVTVLFMPGKSADDGQSDSQRRTKVPA